MTRVLCNLDGRKAIAGHSTILYCTVCSYPRPVHGQLCGIPNIGPSQHDVHFFARLSAENVVPKRDPALKGLSRQRQSRNVSGGPENWRMTGTQHSVFTEKSSAETIDLAIQRTKGTCDRRCTTIVSRITGEKVYLQRFPVKDARRGSTSDVEFTQNEGVSINLIITSVHDSSPHHLITTLHMYRYVYPIQDQKF